MATYTKTGSGAAAGITAATATDVVEQTGAATLTANAQAYALKVDSGAVITATGKTLTLTVTRAEAKTLPDGQAGGAWSFDWKDDAGKVISVERRTGPLAKTMHVEVPDLK